MYTFVSVPAPASDISQFFILGYHEHPTAFRNVYICMIQNKKVSEDSGRYWPSLENGIGGKKGNILFFDVFT